MKWQSIEKVRPVNTGYSTYYPETVQVTDQFPAVLHYFEREYDKMFTAKLTDQSIHDKSHDARGVTFRYNISSL